MDIIEQTEQMSADSPCYSEYIRIIISEDAMEARLYLSSAPDSDGMVHTDLFTLDIIKEELSRAGIKSGIDNDQLIAIVESHLYDKYYVIARGNPAVDGENGYFTYNFKTEIDNKPKLMPDGSVDYRDIEFYTAVNKGTEVVTYTPATSGHYGFNVLGKMLVCNRGTDLRPLEGKGFTLSEDKLHYISNVNGKIEVSEGSLIISNMLDINGDVDLTTGDIIFNGDVIVHGNVSSGVTIAVNGRLTILGNVEGARIKARDSIELKSGMQGGGKGIIECDGEVWGKFFEHTIIRSSGDIHANSIMNCNVVCNSNVIVSGRHGIIVGGNTVAQGNIDATVIGNLAEVKTRVCAGINEKAQNELKELFAQLADLELQLEKHKQVNEKLAAITKPTEPEKYRLMCESVEASMQKLSIQIEQIKLDIDQKKFILSSSTNSKIYIRKYLYPGVTCEISGSSSYCSSALYNVMVKNNSGEIEILNNL